MPSSNSLEYDVQRPDLTEIDYDSRSRAPVIAPAQPSTRDPTRISPASVGVRTRPSSTTVRPVTTFKPVNATRPQPRVSKPADKLSQFEHVTPSVTKVRPVSQPSATRTTPQLPRQPATGSTVTSSFQTQPIFKFGPPLVHERPFAVINDVDYESEVAQIKAERPSTISPIAVSTPSSTRPSTFPRKHLSVAPVVKTPARPKTRPEQKPRPHAIPITVSNFSIPTITTRAPTFRPARPDTVSIVTSKVEKPLD